MEAEDAPAAEVGDELEEAEGLAPVFLLPADRVSAVPVPAGRVCHVQALPGPRHHGHRSPPVDQVQVDQVEVSVRPCPVVRPAAARSAQIFSVPTFNRPEADSVLTSVFRICHLPGRRCPAAIDLPRFPETRVRRCRVVTAPQRALVETVPPRCPAETDLRYRQPAPVVIAPQPCPGRVPEETAPAPCPAGIALTCPATAIAREHCHRDQARGEAPNQAISEISSASTSRCVLPPCRNCRRRAPAGEIGRVVEIAQ